MTRMTRATVPLAALLLVGLIAAISAQLDTIEHGDVHHADITHHKDRHDDDKHHGARRHHDDDKHGDRRHHDDDKHHGDRRHHDDDKHHGDRRHHDDDRHHNYRRHHDDDKHHGDRHHGDHHDKHDKHEDDHKKEEDKTDNHEEEYQELVYRLNGLTARLHHIEEELEKRLDPELRIKAKSLLYRVEELEEDTCDKQHFQCGGFEPECVSKLFVCDGVKDCRNGGDEEHCELPTKQGDTFIGHVEFDHCTQRKPENLSFTITAVRHTSFFTAFPALRAVIHISYEDDEMEGEVAMPTVGYYRFATQNLILLPPEDDRLGLICDFDGSNPDRCVGNIVRETSLEPCARFIFHRETDEEEEEEEDD